MAWFKKKSSRGAVDETAHDDAANEMARLEEQQEVPRDPRDWPTGRTSHLTYGHQGDEAYGEGATAKLGPAEVEHHEDGSVSVGGKRVEDPSAYKGTPITGGIIEQIDGQLERNREIREREERERG